MRSSPDYFYLLFVAAADEFAACGDLCVWNCFSLAFVSSSYHRKHFVSITSILGVIKNKAGDRPRPTRENGPDPIFIFSS